MLCVVLPDFRPHLLSSSFLSSFNFAQHHVPYHVTHLTPDVTPQLYQFLLAFLAFRAFLSFFATSFCYLDIPISSDCFLAVHIVVSSQVPLFYVPSSLCSFPPSFLFSLLFDLYGTLPYPCSAPCPLRPVLSSSLLPAPRSSSSFLLLPSCSQTEQKKREGSTRPWEHTSRALSRPHVLMRLSHFCVLCNNPPLPFSVSRLPFIVNFLVSQKTMSAHPA